MTSCDSQSCVLDWRQLADRCADDDDLVCQVVKAFVDEGKVMLANVSSAVESLDPEAIRSAAHRLKGSAAAISAASLSEAAMQLETAARQENLENVAQLHEDVSSRMNQLMVFLDHPDWVSKVKAQDQ